MKILLTILFAASFMVAQNNVTLLSTLNQYPSAGYSNIWGYVAPNGIEYALLGVRTGTSIISLADPNNPVECAFIPAPQSSWRELKVHGNYAYVATDVSGNGLQIIDLSQLPNTATLVNTLNTYFNDAHDLLIEDGFCYVVGGDGVGGMSILDLSNPVNPVRTAYYTGSGYIHDIYVWNDTVIASCGSLQQYHLIDVTNKSNPQLISASITLPGIYAHSGWMTEDKRYFFATEEFNVRDMTVWDLQDRSSWDLVIPSWGLSNNSVIHNLYIIDNYAHISYYTSGYLVLDITNPLSPQIAGQYDTYPQNNGGTYNGAWGVYPFLPSGNTIISDINTGLYVLRFNGSIPVELTSFSAAVDNQNVTLKWSTSSEKNNQGFEVQRKNESEYYSIGFVEGNGTSTEINNYTFIDRDVKSGNYYYRLKQIDFNGSSDYSDEIFVEITSPIDFELEQNFPNPFNPATTIRFSLPANGFVNLSIYNLVGEKVSELVNGELQQGEHNLTFNASELPSGLYIAKLSAGNFNQSIKMTLLK
ncbi:MAG: choice-of-anchor B family protein [Ignavibacteriaceae bacterium]|jgi:choice-of-anchor B domain-containing protein|nr:choice-of-anchor B family protein [Ignavibacteriaceae bacterium]MCU0412975.1 choice-of-anchor B family protein [Ignavibacteriaceae bacterium]